MRFQSYLRVALFTTLDIILNALTLGRTAGWRGGCVGVSS